MPCQVELIFGGQAEEDGTAVPRESLTVAIPESQSCLSVASFKEAIMEKAEIEEDPDDMAILIQIQKGDPRNNLTGNVMVNDGDRLVAALVKGGGGNEKLNMTVVSDRAVWIVSGNNWGFHVQTIEETNREVPTTIKMNSIRKWEHKFAVVNNMPADASYWIAKRYSLDSEDENATLEITHENEANDAFSVHLVTYQGEVKCSTLLRPDAEEKVFNKNEVNSRKEKLTNALAIGSFVLTVVGAVVGIVAAVPAAAVPAVAAAAVASTATVMNRR